LRFVLEKTKPNYMAKSSASFPNSPKLQNPWWETPVTTIIKTRIKFTSQIYSPPRNFHISLKPTISTHIIISKKSKTTTLSHHYSLHHDNMPINETPFSI